MRWRGFTLMEMAVTIAIAGIVSFAAIGAYVQFLQIGRGVGKDAEVTDLARGGALFIAEELRTVGGGGIPAWSAVIIEDDCLARDGYPACNGSDRLTVVQAIPRFPSCAIEEGVGADQIRVETISLRGSDVCCLNETNFLRQVALVWPDTMQPVVLKSVGRDCLFDVVPIVPGDALPRPLATSSAATEGFPGAVIVLADVKTWYVEWTGPTLGALNMHAELNGDGSVVGERLTVLPTVADFQAAIGYAIDRDDLLDAAAGGDRWWPNNRGESGRPAGSFLPEQAVLAGVSILAATRDSGRSDEVATPWGPTRRVGGGRVRVATERVALENE
jgi:prepilin-type N-terminal cleavage/methylation domain-containing protein